MWCFGQRVIHTDGCCVVSQVVPLVPTATESLGSCILYVIIGATHVGSIKLGGTPGTKTAVAKGGEVAARLHLAHPHLPVFLSTVLLCVDVRAYLSQAIALCAMPRNP